MSGRALWLSTVVGIVLVVAGAGLVALTEHAAVRHREAAERHGGPVLDLASASHAQSGYMLRVSGDVKVEEAPRDPEFNQKVDTPVLIRHVEMFQWREVRIGSEVHYEQDWVDHPLDAAHFEHPAGHANPGAFPLQGKQFDAGVVKVGGFALSPELLHALPGAAVMASPDTASLPPNLAASFSRNGDYLTTSANPAHPRLGDLRVSWEAVPKQLVTVFARLEGNQLAPAAHAADGKGYDVQVGDRRLTDVLPDVPAPPAFAWPRRILAILLAAFGALLLLQGRLEDEQRPIALGAGLLLAGAIGGAMWLGEDLQASAYWFVPAVLGLALAVWRLHVHGQAGVRSHGD
jgi:hypothetical protein